MAVKPSKPSVSMPAHWRKGNSATSVQLVPIALPGSRGSQVLPSSVNPLTFMQAVWQVSFAFLAVLLRILEVPCTAGIETSCGFHACSIYQDDEQPVEHFLSMALSALSHCLLQTQSLLDG